MSAVIFCGNINRSVYNHFGAAQLQSFINRLKEFSQVPVYSAINISGGDIETRGQRLSKQIDRILEVHQLKHCHLVGYSLAGLDARVAAYNNKAVKQVITIGTPNRGSILADLYFQSRMDKMYVDPVCRIIGVEPKYFEEANSDNIQDFNLVYPNRSGVKYYSVGGHIYWRFCADMFRPIIHHLEDVFSGENAAPILSDGVLLEEQSKWGEHLMTVEADHAMLMGIRSNAVADACASVAAQRVSINENIPLVDL